MELNTPVCVLDCAAVLGEGALWSPAENAVWFVDIRSDFIHRFEPATRAHRTWKTPPNPGFILPKKGGGFVVGLRNGVHDFNPATGIFLLRQSVDADLPDNRLNDGHIDASGALWFGTMDDMARNPNGALYRYDGASLAQKDDNIVITNGPAISPDGRTLYHADTLDQSIFAYDLASGGTLSNKREFARVATGYTDGMAIDAEGALWCAIHGGGVLNRYAPSGEMLTSLPFACSKPTKLAFGGADLRDVFVTSANEGLSAAERIAQPQAGGLFRFRSDVPGLQQWEFHG